MFYLESSVFSNRKKFALILTTHRLWGKLFLPCIVSESPEKENFTLSESLLPYPPDDILKILENEEIELVRITNEYSDKQLFKTYSKEKNVRKFLENIKPEITEKFIRPHIERRIRKCFFILRDEGTACFLRSKQSNILYPEDILEIIPDPAIALFRFERGTEHTTYQLTVESEGKKMELYRKAVDILCNDPCIIRYENKILQISGIDGQKLRPFLEKESVIIPKKSEPRYFSGFVLNAVNNYNTEAKGFEILYPESEKRPDLSLEYSIMGYPVLILSYNYSGMAVSPGDKTEYFTVFAHENGEFIYRKYKRDFGWELQCRDILSGIGFNSEDKINFYLQNEDLKPVSQINNVVEAVNRNYNHLVSQGFRIRSKRLDKNYNLRNINIEILNKSEGDWFDLDAVIKIGKWEFSFIKFRNHILKGLREFELPDGTTAILPEEWFAGYRNIFELGKDHGKSIRIHKQHFPLLMEVLEPGKDESLGNLEKLLLPEKLPVPLVPSGLNCRMRDYQHEGLAWLQWLQSARLGGCLADDMGLGKTIQTLALLQMNKENAARHAKPAPVHEPVLFDSPRVNLSSLIIVPPTIIHNWEIEIRKFVPRMNIYILKGSRSERRCSDFTRHDIILSSYHTVRQDIDLLSAFHFHYIVLDESQYIKNPASLVYKSMIRLKSDYRLVLTGTPIENSVSDLWAQLNFLNPGMLGSLNWFKSTYARPIEKDRDDMTENKLKKLIKPFILRRTKEMVAADLPPVSRQLIFCEMTEEQKKIYETEKSAVRNSIIESLASREKGMAAIIVLQGLMKLRQISNHPVMADEEYPYGSGKFETVMNDMENVINEGHKILVFSSFVMHLKLFEKALAFKKIKYSILTGASTNREKIINSFQKDPANKVFLISLKAGGVGLNLTSAHYVFILDPWWNPAAELQAVSRAHRIGQDKNVFIYRYISSGTLEEKIIKLQERKSKLAE
ncbi:MAG: DEAD/DEAH box helicase, partial [Bacteroidales bacterium]|nr:DEAD/DEAH box helicase [Bacteroidales bacterium]